MGGQGPQLIPDDIAERTEMWGVLNELLSNEDGLCTHKRQMAFTKMGNLAEQESQTQMKQFTTSFVEKYQFVDPARAPGRVVEVLQLLDGMLQKQAKRGSKFLVGSKLTALDVYAAASLSVMVAPAGSPMGTKARPQKMFGRNGLVALMN